MTTVEETGTDSLASLELRIARLVTRRQQLREAGSDEQRLEANRKEIVSAQQALSGVLIERHLRHAA